MTIDLPTALHCAQLCATLLKFLPTMKKSQQMNVRLDSELDANFEKARNAVGLETSTIVIALLRAFVHEVEETGKITLPISITSEAKKRDTPAADCPPKNRLSSSTAPRLDPPPPDRLIVNEEPQTRTVMPRARPVKYGASQRSSRITKPTHSPGASQ